MTASSVSIQKKPDEIASARTTAHPSSAWGPLARPVFRALWLAALASNIGSLMQGVRGGLVHDLAD